MAHRKQELSRIYQQFLRLCEQWPVNNNRFGRDLGEYIRGNLKTRYQRQQMNVDEASRTLESLVKLSTNYYKNKYPRENDTGFTGEIMKQKSSGMILSNDGRKVLAEEKKTWWGRFIGRN